MQNFSVELQYQQLVNILFHYIAFYIELIHD
jgi:hypothetical protein